MLCVLVGMDQKDSFQRHSGRAHVDSGSGMCFAGFIGEKAFCAVVPLVVCRPKMLCILVGMDRKDSWTARMWPRSPSTWTVACAWLVSLVHMNLSCVPLFGGRPMMPGIMVGVTLRNALLDNENIFCVSPGLDDFPTSPRADGTRTLWLILVLFFGQWIRVHS